MNVLNILQSYGVLNISVVLAIVGIMYTLRKQVLNDLLKKIVTKWKKWLLLTGLALVLSCLLTLISFVNGVNIREWIRLSVMNWVFSWVFYDTIKNIFIRNNRE